MSIRRDLYFRDFRGLLFETSEEVRPLSLLLCFAKQLVVTANQCIRGPFKSFALQALKRFFVGPCFRVLHIFACQAIGRKRAMFDTELLVACMCQL